MPEDGLPDAGRYNLLTLEELTRIGRVFVTEGIRKIRLTGGEPLLRRDVHVLIRELGQLDGLEDLCLTTNGHFLAERAELLASSGLRRVNVSLDSLNAQKFQTITRGGDLSRVLMGLRKAKKVFPKPVKINAVIAIGVNDKEILDFARLTLDPGYHVRFIEPMPMNEGLAWRRERVFPVRELRARIADAYGLEPVCEPGELAGPAQRYRIPGATGELGFIGAVTDEFCAGCNRIRLTPDGKLRGCLIEPGEIDLRSILRNGASDSELREELIQLINKKSERHRINDLPEIYTPQSMSRIGG